MKLEELEKQIENNVVSKVPNNVSEYEIGVEYEQIFRINATSKSSMFKFKRWFYGLLNNLAKRKFNINKELSKKVFQLVANKIIQYHETNQLTDLPSRFIVKYKLVKYKDSVVVVITSVLATYYQTLVSEQFTFNYE